MSDGDATSPARFDATAIGRRAAALAVLAMLAGGLVFAI